jgi:hypothetical protein
VLVVGEFISSTEQLADDSAHISSCYNIVGPISESVLSLVIVVLHGSVVAVGAGK